MFTIIVSKKNSMNILFAFQENEKSYRFGTMCWVINMFLPLVCPKVV